MKVGFRILGMGANLSCSLNELSQTVILSIVAIPSVLYWYFSGKAIYKKLTSSSNEVKNDKGESQSSPQAQKAIDIKGDYADPSEGQLLGELVYKEDIVMWYGTPGSGKTSAAFQLAIDLSLGNRSKLTLPEIDSGLHNPEHIIYYDMEMDVNDYEIFFGLYDRSQLSNIDFYLGNYFANPEMFVKDVEKKLLACNGDTVVFVDNASCIGITLNADVIRQLFLGDFKKIQKDSKKRGFTVTFVVIAHTNKEQKLHGSSNLANFCSTMLKMERVPNENCTILHVEKNRKYGAMQDKKFKLNFCTIDGHKGFVNVGEIKQSKHESPEKGANNNEPMFGSYTLSQAKEIYELSQKRKPNPKGEGTLQYSLRDIAEAASFKISHTKVGELIRQYEAYNAKNSSPESESDEYNEYEEVE